MTLDEAIAEIARLTSELERFRRANAERQRRYRVRAKDRNVTRNVTGTPSEVLLPPPPETTPQRGKRWPDGAVVPPPWIKAAAAARVRAGKGQINLEAEAERFANHFASKPATMLDWRRAWLNWATSPFVEGLKNGKAARQPRNADFARGVLSELERIGGTNAVRPASEKAADSEGILEPAAGDGGGTCGPDWALDAPLSRRAK